LSKRKAVYVAGPITCDNPFTNMQIAIAIGQDLIDAGFAPYVPHLTVYWDKLHNPAENSWETWLEIDLPWVSKADAVLRLPGESTGADREVALAQELGIPVFHFMKDLMASFGKGFSKAVTVKAKEPEKPVSAKTGFQTYCGCPPGESRAPTEGNLPASIEKVLDHITQTFVSKNADYSADADGWRSSFDDIARQCGISATEAANTLIAVKQARLRALQANGRAPANEAIEDTLLDRAVYSVLALALWQEDNT